MSRLITIDNIKDLIDKQVNVLDPKVKYKVQIKNFQYNLTDFINMITSLFLTGCFPIINENFTKYYDCDMDIYLEFFKTEFEIHPAQKEQYLDLLKRFSQYFKDDYVFTNLPMKIDILKNISSNIVKLSMDAYHEISEGLSQQITYLINKIDITELLPEIIKTTNEIKSVNLEIQSIKDELSSTGDISSAKRQKTTQQNTVRVIDLKNQLRDKEQKLSVLSKKYKVYVEDRDKILQDMKNSNFTIFGDNVAVSDCFKNMQLNTKESLLSYKDELMKTKNIIDIVNFYKSEKANINNILFDNIFYYIYGEIEDDDQELIEKFNNNYNINNNENIKLIKDNICNLDLSIFGFKSYSKYLCKSSDIPKLAIEAFDSNLLFVKMYLNNFYTLANLAFYNYLIANKLSLYLIDIIVLILSSFTQYYSKFNKYTTKELLYVNAKYNSVQSAQVFYNTFISISDENLQPIQNIANILNNIKLFTSKWSQVIGINEDLKNILNVGSKISKISLEEPSTSKSKKSKRKQKTTTVQSPVDIIPELKIEQLTLEEPQEFIEPEEKTETLIEKQTVITSYPQIATVSEVKPSTSSPIKVQLNVDQEKRAEYQSIANDTNIIYSKDVDYNNNYEILSNLIIKNASKLPSSKYNYLDYDIRNEIKYDNNGNEVKSNESPYIQYMPVTCNGDVGMIDLSYPNQYKLSSKEQRSFEAFVINSQVIFSHFIDKFNEQYLSFNKILLIDGENMLKNTTIYEYIKQNLNIPIFKDLIQVIDSFTKTDNLGIYVYNEYDKYNDVTTLIDLLLRFIKIILSTSKDINNTHIIITFHSSEFNIQYNAVKNDSYNQYDITIIDVPCFTKIGDKVRSCAQAYRKNETDDLLIINIYTYYLQCKFEVMIMSMDNYKWVPIIYNLDQQQNTTQASKICLNKVQLNNVNGNVRIVPMTTNKYIVKS